MVKSKGTQAGASSSNPKKVIKGGDKKEAKDKGTDKTEANKKVVDNQNLDSESSEEEEQDPLELHGENLTELTRDQILVHKEAMGIKEKADWFDKLCRIKPEGEGPPGLSRFETSILESIAAFMRCKGFKREGEAIHVIVHCGSLSTVTKITKADGEEKKE